MQTLLNFCSPLDSDPANRRDAMEKDAALLRGALVLLCSHLEGYFEELVTDALRAFDLLAPDVEAIPFVIRHRQVSSGLQNGGDPQREWPLLRACMAHPLMRGDPCSPGTRRIDPELHTAGFANPGTGEIARLMKSIGIADCWPPVQAVVGRAKISTVDAVVNRRNQIAHGDLESSVSRVDAERYVDDLQAVCVEFDRVVSEHIASCTGQLDPWRRLSE